MGFFKSKKTPDTGGHSVVRSTSGQPIGLWVSERSDTRDKTYLKMLSIEYNMPTEMYAALDKGDYRVVRNKYDDSGGYFIMLGGNKAPGER